VLASGVGVDLLVLAVGCLLLLTLDRTVGDWMAETLGSGPGTAAFGLAVVGFTWYFLSYPSDDFFAAAEKRGYRTAYYQPTPASAIPAESAGAPGSGGAYVQSAGTPSSRGGEADPSGVVNKETQADKARSAEDSATTAADEGAVAKSVESSSSQGPAPGPSSIASASRIVFGAAGKAAAPTASRVVLTVMPERVSPAVRTVFQVVVTAAGRPVTAGAVIFTVNGTGVGKVALDSRGAATTSFASHIAGTYEVRARFLGTANHEPSLSDAHALHVTQR
jgi:hypothetical protein